MNWTYFSKHQILFIKSVDYLVRSMQEKEAQRILHLSNRFKPLNKTDDSGKVERFRQILQTIETDARALFMLCANRGEKQSADQLSFIISHIICMDEGLKQ